MTPTLLTLPRRSVCGFTGCSTTFRPTSRAFSRVLAERTCRRGRTKAETTGRRSATAGRVHQLADIATSSSSTRSTACSEAWSIRRRLNWSGPWTGTSWRGRNTLGRSRRATSSARHGPSKAVAVRGAKAPHANRSCTTTSDRASWPPFGRAGFTALPTATMKPITWSLGRLMISATFTGSKPIIGQES